jgi:hypothetical protein
VITTVIRRVVPVLCLAGVVLGLVRKQAVPALGSDGYFHLRMGQEFLSGDWSIRAPGHFSEFDTAAWLPTQWASQLLMAGAHDLAGMAGFIWVTGTMLLAVPVALYLGSRAAGASPLPAAVSMGLALLAMSSGLSARPQVLSYVLITVFTVAWLRTAHDRRPRYWLVLLNWVWVPVHGMWFIGILIGAVTVLGMLIEAPREYRKLAPLAAIPAGSALIAMATPLGWEVYGTIGAVGSRARILTEWQPTDFTQAPALVLVAMAAVVLLVGLRRQAMTWPELLLLGLAVAWGLYTNRTVDVAAAMLAAPLAIALERLSPAGIALTRRESAVVGLAAVIGALALWPVANLRADRESEPKWINDRLGAMPGGTKVLNDWELGHDLLYRQPHIQLVMHGYLDVFTPDEIDRNTDIAGLEPGWDDEVEELDVDYALVRKDSPLGYALGKDDWTEVEGDKTYVLLTPPD